MDLCVTLYLWYFLFLVSAASPDLYCGEQNCYDVLSVSRDSSKSEISKSYRKLAGKWHPDRFQSKEDKHLAETNFMEIATAYEVLKDEDSRAEYDYMLDHPEEMWQNYYRYYKRRMAPKIDVRIVVAAAISVISFIQYYSAWSNYEEAINCLVQIPKYRIQASQIAQSCGMLRRDKKCDKGRTKEQIKKEEELIIRKVIEEKMDIKGSYAKPSIANILWVQLFLLPVTLYRWVYFYIRWFWMFQIKGENYGTEEKLYLIRKNMNLSEGQFGLIEDEVKENYLIEELWIPHKFQVWKEQEEHQRRIKMAQSGRYKQYRRYMKNHGPDRMLFDDS